MVSVSLWLHWLQCVRAKYHVPVSLQYTKLKGEWTVLPCRSLFRKALHVEDNTRLTRVKDKYWIHMPGYFQAFLFMHIKAQMNSDYLKWAVQNIVLPGSGLQGIHGFMGFENILMD